jgi:RND family efflux transporter MFP subunit
MITALAVSAMLAVAPTTTTIEPVHVVLEAQYRTEIAAQVISTVTNISRRMGDAFEEGEVLIRLDDRIYLSHVAKAESKVEEGKAKYAVARRLHADKIISAAELLTGKAALAQAEADLAVAEKALDDCTIRAPYKGKVQQVFVELYERVEPGQKLIEVLDESVLLVRFFIDSSLVSAQLQPDKLQFRIAGADTVRTASLMRIAPGIDPASSLIRIEAEIDNADGQLRPGMTGTLILLADTEGKSNA